MGRSRVRSLLVVTEDLLSDIVAKGEVTPRYFNPCDAFQEVHLVLLSDDGVSAEDLAPMAGAGRLVMHRLGAVRLRGTLGWRPRLMEKWVKATTDVIAEVRPTALRTHGNYVAGYVAAQARLRTGVPLVVSLHGQPDEWSPGPLGPKASLLAFLRRRLERETLSSADVVIAVYRQLVPHARRLGAADVRVIHNYVADDIAPKTTYALHDAGLVVSVGRHCRGKEADQIIRGVASVPRARLRLIGQGPLLGTMRDVARRTGAGDRIEFVPAVPNRELCDGLCDHDVFAIRCDSCGIPKTLIEAMLAGMPCVVNRRDGEPVPEIPADAVMYVEGGDVGYRDAIEALLSDEALRRTLGHKGRKFAQRTFAPAAMESAVSGIYAELSEGAGRVAGGGVTSA